MSHSQDQSGKAGVLSKLKAELNDDAQRLNLLVQEMYDYCLNTGNLMKIHTDPVKEPFKAHMSSTTLLPTQFSKKVYESAVSLQPIYNTLYRRIAMDSQFLLESLSSLGDHDEFVHHLLEIYRTLLDEGVTQIAYLGLFRSDYMYDSSSEGIKQVEMNTMSAAASGVNRAANKWHRYLMGPLLGVGNEDIPENSATMTLAETMVKAWELYSSKRSVVAFLVGKLEFNFADQRSLQYDIHQVNSSVKVIRVTFEDLAANMSLDKNRRLYVGEEEVAVFYYRYGYSPKHYISEKFWRIRMDVEKSLAIKCPSINSTLAGTKRVQQVIAKPGVLERWLDKPSADAIRDTFVGLYSFEGSEAESSISLALQTPDRFILKPQRDGGGNNFYGDEMIEKLNTLSADELVMFTLMEKISPPLNTNYIISGIQGELRPQQLVSELGIFGAILVDDSGEEVVNRGAGFLLRSKDHTAREGDLMRGTSSLDSLWLVDP